MILALQKLNSGDGDLTLFRLLRYGTRYSDQRNGLNAFLAILNIRLLGQGDQLVYAENILTTTSRILNLIQNTITTARL